METLKKDIKSLLVSKKELNKKQVALFLKQDQIDALDKIVKDLSNYSNGRVNRNILIEMAVENLIHYAPIVLAEHIKECEEEDTEKKFDCILCCSQDGGEDFLKTNKRWQYVRINSDKIKYLKYIALYVGAPTSAIVCWAKIKGFDEKIMEDKQKKYIIYIEDKVNFFKNPIKLGNLNALHTRNVRYTNLETLEKAKEYSDIL